VLYKSTFTLPYLSDVLLTSFSRLVDYSVDVKKEQEQNVKAYGHTLVGLNYSVQLMPFKSIS